MKYLNKFSDKASYEAWKSGDSFIKPSLNLTNGGEMMYDYDPHFRAKYLFGDGNDISTNLTQCGNIFESLKINGVEYSDGNVQVEDNSTKYGSQGEIIYHEMTYNSSVCEESEFNWRSYAIPFNSTFTFQIIEPIDDISNILVGAFSFMNKPQLITQTDLLVIDSGQQIFSFGFGDMAYLISSLELYSAYACVVVQNQSSGEYYTVKIQSQTISGELKNGTPYSCTNGDFQLSGTTLISPTDKYVSGDNCCVTVRTSAETSAYGVLIHLMDADKTTITFSTDELYQTFGIQFDNVSKSIVIPNDVVFYAQTAESAPVKGGRMVFALIDMSNSANTISSTTEVILPSEVTYTYEEFDILENNTVSNANEWNGVVFSTDIPLRKYGACWVVCNGYVDGDESNLPYFYICNDEDVIIEDNTYQFSEIGINNINTYFGNLNCTSIDCFTSYEIRCLTWLKSAGFNENMILTLKSYYALPYYISDIQITGGAPQIIKGHDIVPTTRTETKHGYFGEFVQKETIFNDENVKLESMDKCYMTEYVPFVPGLTVEPVGEIGNIENLCVMFSSIDMIDMSVSIPVSALTCIDETNHKYLIEAEYGSEYANWISTFQIYHHAYGRAFGVCLVDSSSLTVYETKASWSEMVYEKITNTLSMTKDDWVLTDGTLSLKDASKFDKIVLNSIKNTSDITENLGFLMYVYSENLGGSNVEIYDQTNISEDNFFSSITSSECYINSLVIDHYKAELGDNICLLFQYIDLDKCDYDEINRKYTLRNLDAILSVDATYITEVYDAYPPISMSSANDLDGVVIKPYYDFKYEKCIWPFLYNDSGKCASLTSTSLEKVSDGWVLTEEGKGICEEFLKLDGTLHLMHGIGQIPLIIGADETTPISYFENKNATLPLLTIQNTIDVELPYELNVIGRISDKVNFIPKEGFKDSCLDSVIIQEGIETIQAKAFYNCPKMRHAWLPSTMKSIGNEGFMGTIKEQSCFGLDNVKTIGRDVFGDIKTLSNYVRVIFDVKDISQPTALYSSVDMEWYLWMKPFDSTQLEGLIIDNVNVQVNPFYQFTTTGKHEVIYKFKEQPLKLDGLLTPAYQIGDEISYSGNCISAEVNLTSPVISMLCFPGPSLGLTSLTFTSIDTSQCTNMYVAYNNTSALTSLDLSQFDFSNVADMTQMFYNCRSLKSIKFPTERKITLNTHTMNSMFHSCASLTSLDLSCFDTSNVADMGSMFYGCSGLTSVTFGSQADVSNVTSYSDMFGSITTTGTLYYPSEYADAWNNILVTNQSTSLFPQTWNAQPIGGGQ